MESNNSSLVPFVPLVHSTNRTSSTSEFKYQFDKSSKKFLCPTCQKKTFVLYVDAVTGNYLPEKYGKCDRESNCGYFLKPPPSETVNFNPYHFQVKQALSRKPERVYFPAKVFEHTLQPKQYELNVFLQNLLSRIPYPVEASDLEKVVSMYYLGTIAKGERKGAVSFPFIDRFGNVRAVQVKQFDQTNHTVSTDWLHSIIGRDASNKPAWLEAYQKQDSKVSCLFGEHLLALYPNNPIALVEAPKTAVYGTLYFGLPESLTDWIWLAVYNLTSFSLEKCRVLVSRKVFLFPDLSKDGKAFSLWSSRAKEMEAELKGTRFTVSDLLEREATEAERLAGHDLADYLIKLDWRKFRI